MARIHEMLILTGTVCAITAELALAMNDKADLPTIFFVNGLLILFVIAVLIAENRGWNWNPKR